MFARPLVAAVLLGVAALLLGVFTVPAAGQEPEPLPDGTWVVPRDGASRPASSWPAATPFEMIEFTIYVEATYEEEVHDFEIEVSAGPELDPDGTLADAGRIDEYVASPREAAPAIFSARTDVASQWLSIPGSYYWQAHYVEHGELYATPVRRLNVTPRAAPDPPVAAVPTPPVASALPVFVPAPLAASTVRIIVRRAITQATRRSARVLLYRCASAPGGVATCRPSWRDAHATYHGTLRIRSGLSGLDATFSGTTAARACDRRCARAIDWSTSL